MFRQVSRSYAQRLTPGTTIYTGLWLKTVGLVQRSAAIWHRFCIHRVNRVNSRNALLWWQHHKYLRGYYYYTGWPRKKRPKLSCGVMQQSRWSKSAEKHVCNEQTSSNVSIKFHLKHFHISRCTREIVLHVIKQCLQAVRHLCCWLYAGYTRTSQ